MDVQTRCDILKTVEEEVKLLLSAITKSYIPRRFAQQWVTRSAVAELLVFDAVII